MQLTQFTDFGLRVLMYLTYRERTDLVTIAEMAEKFSISRNHLTKVVNHLVRLGWVHSTRGRKGGLQLAIAPELLGIGTVIKKLESHDEVIDCTRTSCALLGNCRLKNMIDQGMQQYFQWMDQYTLADTVTEPTGQVISRLHQLHSSTH